MAWPVLNAEFGYQTCRETTKRQRRHRRARERRRRRGREGETHLTGLHDLLLVRERVGRVGGDDALDRARLDGDGAEGDAAEASAADDDRLRPPRERLLEGALVEEARQPAAVGLVRLAGEEPARVVRALDRLVVDRAVPRVDRGEDRERRAARLGHEREPLDDAEDALEVVGGREVRHAVLVHDLGAAELEVARVDLATEHLVERAGAREDDRLALDLDGALAEADEVGADADRAGRDERDREDVVVRARRLAGDEARALERLDAEAVLEADDVGDLVPRLAVLVDLGREDALVALVVELAELLGREVQVLEALLGARGVDPRDAELVDELLGDAKAGARVGRQVDARQAELARELGHGEEVAVLVGAERADLERDVVGDGDDAAARRVLGRADREDPADHADVVGAGRARDLLRDAELVEDELLGDERLGGRRLADRLPLLADRLAEQVGEVVRVRRADDVRLVALGLEPLLGRVGEVDRLEVERALRADRLEDDLALVGRHLAVRLVLDDEARHVLDDGADRLDVALGVLDDDADLGARDAQTPEALAVTVDEAGERRLDLLEVEAEAVEEVELREAGNVRERERASAAVARAVRGRGEARRNDGERRGERGKGEDGGRKERER